MKYLPAFISLEGIEYVLGMFVLLVLINFFALVYFIKKRGFSRWLVVLFSGWLITSLLLQQLADYTYSDSLWHLSLIFWSVVLPLTLLISSRVAMLTKALSIGLIFLSLIMGYVNYQAYHKLLFYKKMMGHRPTMINLYRWVYDVKVSDEEWKVFFEENLTKDNLEDAIKLILRDYEHADANLLTKSFGRLTLKAWADYNDQHPEEIIEFEHGVTGELVALDRLIASAFVHPDFLSHWLNLVQDDKRNTNLLQLVWRGVLTTDPYWLGAGDEYTVEEIIRLSPAIERVQQTFTDFDEQLTAMKHQADSVDALVIK